MAEYDKVHIKSLGRPKLLKLMRGGAIRVKKPESVMEAMEMFVMPHHSKMMMSKFGKGQAHTLKLSPSEIERNSMEGGSLYSMAKKALKYASPVLKQGARLGIATGSAALAASNPALIPFIPAGAAMLGGISDSAFDELSNMNVDSVDEGYGSPEVGQYGRMVGNYATEHIQKHPSYQRGLSEVSKYAPLLHETDAQSYLQHAQENPYSQVGNAGMRELAQYGNLGSNYHKLANQMTSAQHRQSVNPEQSHQLRQSKIGQRATRGRGMFAGGGMYAGGKGLYAGDMRGRGIEKSTVRIGGNLISAFGGVHPAVMSAPLSVNFASKNFMSPAMAAMIQ